MPWPSSPTFGKTNTDAGSDSPAAARGDLHALMEDVEDMIESRGQPEGVAALDEDGKVPQSQTFAPLVNGRFVDSTPGSGKTWTVPPGVTRVRVTVVGGGGGGGYTSEGTGGDHGGGGGAGGVAVKDFGVVPGSDFLYTVGAGGAGKQNNADGDGENGEYSDCLSPEDADPAELTITCNGGEGGQGPPDCFGGGGGSATGGDLNFNGGAGASGATRGGMGGGNMFTGGVAGAAGYGGGGGFGSGGGTSAFDGLDGFVMFEW